MYPLEVFALKENLTSGLVIERRVRQHRCFDRNAAKQFGGGLYIIKGWQILQRRCSSGCGWTRTFVVLSGTGTDLRGHVMATIWEKLVGVNIVNHSANALEIETGAAPVFSIIWLHGLGADARDFEDLPRMLSLPQGLPIRFILPNAPERPITLNGGMVMRGWYDLTGLEIIKQEDIQGLAEARDIVDALVEREGDRGIPRSRIVVGGFSQGGAVSLHYGLQCAEPIGGIVGLSTYLPMSERFGETKSPAALATPIFLAHGLFDPVLMLALGEASRQVLTDHGCDITWHTYPMPHTVVPEEIKDLSNWFSAKIWPTGVSS